MKKIFAMSLAAVLSLSLLAGCTGKEQNGTPAGGQTGTTSVARPASDYVGGPAGGKPAQKVEVNFEGRVTAVEDGKVTLEDGSDSHRWCGYCRSRWQRRENFCRRLHSGLCGRP